MSTNRTTEALIWETSGKRGASIQLAAVMEVTVNMLVISIRIRTPPTINYCIIHGIGSVEVALVFIIKVRCLSKARCTVTNVMRAIGRERNGGGVGGKRGGRKRALHQINIPNMLVTELVTCDTLNAHKLVWRNVRRKPLPNT